MTTRWKKVLYDRQGVPDNYVSNTFLSDLRKNINLYKYSWWEAFTGVCPVTHEVSCTILFIIAFIFLENEIYSIVTIVVSVTVIIIISLLIHHLTCSTNDTSLFPSLQIKECFKSSIIFLFFGYVFSPVLNDLTKTISTDTIYAMVTLMMITHVLLQDYGADAAIVSSSLSLNSALFAAVCLSSRLPTVLHTFALVLLAVKIFVLLPFLRRKYKSNICGMLIITVTYLFIVLIALFHLSVTYAVLFAILCLFINVLFPAMFVYYHKYKENIFGPWDEAIVKQES